MLSGPLLSKIILFALPLAATSILQQLFNAVDTAVVGRFASSQAMAAVGSNTSIINLIIALFVGLSVGGNVVIASLIGRQKQDEIADAVHTAVVVALASGFILLAAGQLIAVPLLRMVKTPEDVIGLASLYLRIYFLGMPFIMFYNFGSAILRSKGDSSRPLYALITGGIVNVILNLILVIVFHLHVIGVAAATVTSNAISAGVIFRILHHETDFFRVEIRKLRVNRKHLVRMMRIGLPAGLQGIVFSLSNTVIQSGINDFGSMASAGSAAALNYEIVAYYFVAAFNQAAVTFTSQNFSAGKYGRCKSVFRITLVSSVIATAVFDYTVLFFRGPLLAVFTSDPEVYAFAAMRLFCVLAFQCMVNSYEISGSAMRGMGYSLTPTILMIFGTCVFRILWVLKFFPRFHTFRILLMVYPASWILTGLLVLPTYLVLRRKLFRQGERMIGGARAFLPSEPGETDAGKKSNEPGETDTGQKKIE